MAHTIIISEAGAGQSVLRFLERRLNLPRPLLYRWFRTGQVRLNKGRVKGRELLRAGDELRLPPQAGGNGGGAIPAASRIDEKDLGVKIVFQDENLLVLDKPPFLPVQPGSGHADSLSGRLAALAGGMRAPAPVHRLDKAASGLLLAAKSHIYSRYLHTLFEKKAALERDYLVWCAGIWHLQPGTRLTDRLKVRTGPDGLELVDSSSDGDALEADALAETLRVTENSPAGPASLMLIRLLSGRKHQIRVQCGMRGHPVIGDPKYGGPRYPRLLLHAAFITIPSHQDFLGQAIPEFHFASLPDWPEPFAVIANDITARSGQE